MNFSAFHEDNWKYSKLDLWLLKLLHYVTFQKSEYLKKKIVKVDEYVKNMHKIY